jgi:galactokinase/mevalonate kinase-like predicted kinase
VGLLEQFIQDIKEELAQVEALTIQELAEEDLAEMVILQQVVTQQEVLGELENKLILEYTIFTGVAEEVDLHTLEELVVGMEALEEVELERQTQALEALEEDQH